MDDTNELLETPAGTCFHCGLEVPPDSHFETPILGKPRALCCAGCEAVAEAIVAAGQESFYNHRTEFMPRGDVLVPDFLRELEVYDNPEIQKSFVVDKGEHTREASLLLEGITCAACVWLNERHIAGLEGVLTVRINYATHRALVLWDDSRIHLSDILAAIRAIGYAAHPYDPEQQHSVLQRERKAALRRIGVAGIFGMQIMVLAVALYLGDWTGIDERYRNLFNWAGLIFVSPILLYSARPFYRAALRDLQSGQMGMDIPVALGISIAFGASVFATVKGEGHVYYDSVAMFVFFVLTARFFEFRAREHSADVNERLTQGMPATARRYLPDSDDCESVAVAELSLGDRVQIRPGELVPADGDVLDGVSSVDESLLSGESLPRTVGVGDSLVGGSLNVESPLDMRVTSVGQDTVLSHMLRLMERAQTEKPRVALLANRLAGYFVTGILAIATIAGTAWYLAGNPQWLEIVISLLVVTCPCALSLATPAAMTAATSALAGAGLLITRGNALETLSKVTDFAFDKTGTLTDGELRLHALHNYSTFTDAHVHGLAASLEQASEHLLARAVTASAQANDVVFEDLVVTELRQFPGRGVRGRINGVPYAVGSARFVADDCGVRLTPEQVQDIDASGASQVVLATDNAVLAVLLFTDNTRPGGRALITSLADKKIATHVLTGDTESAAARVASELGIAHVRARMRPDDKLAALKALQAEGKVVAMLGDGVNDAPVLAGAEVSIAMGSAAQLAKFNSDVVLVSNSLETLSEGVVHASKTVTIIRENFAWALLYNMIGIPAAAAGWVTPWMAAIGMSLSSLLVVLNSSRLRKMNTPRSDT